MKLTPDQIETVHFWMKDKRITHTCPMCTHKGLTVRESLTLLPDFDISEGGTQSNKVIPTVILVCKECGHYLFFSASAIGLHPSEAVHKKKRS